MTPKEFRGLFEEFTAASWQPWNSIEDAVFGLVPDDPELVRRVTARTALPTEQVQELWAIVGRGGGKSREAARLACFMACGRAYHRVPGESLYVGVAAPDRKQARLTFRYIVGLLRSVPALAALIVSETLESVELSTGIVIETITASTAAPRGRSYIAFVIEEAAFLGSEESAEPDIELLRAVRPALARVPGSLLAVISSPYSQQGELHRVWSTKFGVNDDDLLVVQASTEVLNPSFSLKEIARAYRDDPVAAEAEYGASFRKDVSSLLMDEAISAVTPLGVRERAPDSAIQSTGHLDMATGMGLDAAAVSIAGHDGRESILQAVRQWPPPFNPSDVCAEVARLCHRYHVTEITVDRFAPGLVIDLLRRQGIEARVAELDTSAAFTGLLALINSRMCSLLDDAVLLRELRGLERRTAPGGRDRVGHGARGHDDAAASAAFCLLAASHEAEMPPFTLMGSTEYQEWEAQREPLEPDDNDDEDEQPEADDASPSLFAVVQEAAAGVLSRARGQMAALTQESRNLAQVPGQMVDDVKKRVTATVDRVLPKDEADARQRSRLKADVKEATRQREAAQRFITECCRKNGGVWFPGDTPGRMRE